VAVYGEGKRSSGFDTDRPEYTVLREHVADGGVNTVIVPNLSRLSRDRKERLRLSFDGDAAGVAVHLVKLGRAVDLDDDRALVHQSIRASTDDVEGHKEVARSKRATQERIENGYDHGRSPFGLTHDEDGRYSVPNHDIEEYRTALACIRPREDAVRGGRANVTM
jgi:DNA invertase Pin-like site-specific DNA recombinase